jgi:hypothetical protein
MLVVWQVELLRKRVATWTTASCPQDGSDSSPAEAMAEVLAPVKRSRSGELPDTVSGGRRGSADPHDRGTGKESMMEEAASRHLAAPAFAACSAAAVSAVSLGRCQS